VCPLTPILGVEACHRMPKDSGVPVGPFLISLEKLKMYLNDTNKIPKCHWHNGTPSTINSHATNDPSRGHVIHHLALHDPAEGQRRIGMAGDQGGKWGHIDTELARLYHPRIYPRH